MTKIAFVSDVHLGNHKRHGGDIIAGLNQRCREGIDVFSRAIQYAEEQNCDAFVVNGDLFDTCKPEPQLIAEVQRILNSTDMEVILLLGNHEQNSTQAGDHSLVPLRDHATVVDQPRAIDVGDTRICLLPFCPKAAHEYITEGQLRSLVGVGQQKRLVCAHVGVSDERSPKFLVGSHDSIDEKVFRKVLQSVGAHAAFVGNWHNHQVFHGDPTIFQTGALVPTGWDNPGLGYGCVAVFDSESGRAEIFSIHGPRFLKVSTTEEIESATAALLENLYVQAVVHPDEALAFQAILDEFKKDGKIVSGEVLADPRLAEESARMAAHVARSASTLDMAVSSWVREMPLDNNVSRENVLTRIKGYLK